MFKDGWYLGCKYIQSENYNQRSSNDDCDIDLVVIHCISLPEGAYDNQNVENLFQNKLECGLDKSFESLEDVKVSAHFYIKRYGEIIQFVSVNDRAWHAGISEYNGRKCCNDFSVGIEMQGTDKTNYESEQYNSLNKLLKDLRASYPRLQNIIGHEDIAPGRKTDPGIRFDWDKIK
ncbi:MAG: AmpD protein [Francisella sp.]|jgi:AmpD protein